MGRAPCCDKMGVKRGYWTAEEDRILIDFIQRNGHGNWRALPKQAGLLRCGKSCRLRWTNHLKPDIKRGNFTFEEEEGIIKLHQAFGNRWSGIASCLPGRTDNEIKNVWNTHLKKRHLRMGIEGIEPVDHSATPDNLGITFPCQTNAPTTLSYLPDSNNPSTVSEDSASISEWLQSSYENSSVGCDQELSTIGDGAKLEDLLIDERITLENQNFEGEERWFPMQSLENVMPSEEWWEQSLILNTYYLMSAYPEDKILSSTDGEGTNPGPLWKGGDDNTTDYWLNLLSQSWTLP